MKMNCKQRTVNIYVCFAIRKKEFKFPMSAKFRVTTCIRLLPPGGKNTDRNISVNKLCLCCINEINISSSSLVLNEPRVRYAYFLRWERIRMSHECHNIRVKGIVKNSLHFNIKLYGTRNFLPFLFILSVGE